MGTIVNGIAIIVGGIIGLVLHKGIQKELHESLFKVLGVGIIIVGINGVITNMISASSSELSSSGELLLIVSLAIGCVIGESLKIDDHLNGLGKKIEGKFSVSGFANSFVNGTLIYCVGAMAIVGALNDGLLHDSSILYIKSLLDGITSIILGATMGMGVIFSAIPVVLYQGLITLGASSLSGLLTGTLLHNICMVGYTLVICIGVNFIFPEKFKVANLLPALLIPVVYQILVTIV